ncbi:hypothetical protein, partial [Brucella grignonensis]|uniref:hypothetical protein n=1 Tax=Brucella grignonensis TaxID=94627 RepID=UPI001ABFF820
RPEYSNPKPLERTQNSIKLGATSLLLSNSSTRSACTIASDYQRLIKWQQSKASVSRLIDLYKVS